MAGTYNGPDFREGFDISTGSYSDGGAEGRAMQQARSEQRAQAAKNIERASNGGRNTVVSADGKRTLFQGTQAQKPLVMAPNVAQPRGRVRSPAPRQPLVQAPVRPQGNLGMFGGIAGAAGGLSGAGWGWGSLNQGRAPAGPLQPWRNAQTVGWGLVAGSQTMPPGARPGNIPQTQTDFQLLPNQGTQVAVNPVSSVFAGYQSVLRPSTQAMPAPQSTGGTYTIKAGDTLASIASRLGTSVSELKKNNPNIQDANKIYAGNQIKFGSNLQGYASSASVDNSALSAIANSTGGIPSGPEWDAYYAGVKGSANFFSGGKNGVGDVNNVVSTPYTTRNGKQYNLSLNPDAQAAFVGFLGDLEATGYDIENLGSQVIRNKRGSDNPSEHSYGTAIDINGEIVEGEKAARNQYGKNLVTDLPDNVSQMAAKWGLSWGGDWDSTKDAMHFEYTGRKPFKG